MKKLLLLPLFLVLFLISCGEGEDPCASFKDTIAAKKKEILDLQAQVNTLEADLEFKNARNIELETQLVHTQDSLNFYRDSLDVYLFTYADSVDMRLAELDTLRNIQLVFIDGIKNSVDMAQDEENLMAYYITLARIDGEIGTLNGLKEDLDQEIGKDQGEEETE